MMKNKRNKIITIVIAAALVLFMVQVTFIYQMNSHARENARQIQEKNQKAFDKFYGVIDRTNYPNIVKEATENPQHVYYSGNEQEFADATKKGAVLLHELSADPTNESKNAELRAILTPLVEKYFPAIDASKLTDEEVQGTFYYGFEDLRFGLLTLDVIAPDVFNPATLDEVLAFDASNMGMGLFGELTSYNQLKEYIINKMSYGPFINP